MGQGYNASRETDVHCLEVLEILRRAQISRSPVPEVKTVKPSFHALTFESGFQVDDIEVWILPGIEADFQEMVTSDTISTPTDGKQGNTVSVEAIAISVRDDKAVANSFPFRFSVHP